MLKRKGQIAIILLLLVCGIGNAIAQKRNALTITEDRLILKLDLQSPKKQIDSILKIAGISGTDAGKVLQSDFTAIRNDGWNMAERNGSVVKFNRSLSVINDNPQSRSWQITSQIQSIDGQPGYPQAVAYGVNKYAKITVYELSSGLTRFILPGFSRSKRAFLSGNFNGWSTLRGLMKKSDGGWIIDVKLDPGAYEYKFIVDGRWITDPDNLQQTDDGAGNVNSVYYKYNYTFKLPGFSSAQRVTLAGDFNNWNGNELILQEKANAWVLPMYLADGKHLYRFLVDGKWVTDPINPVKENGNDGILSSVLSLGETINFKLAGYPSAKKVFIAGSFNHWAPNELSLKKTGNAWMLPLILTAGNYNYKFIVDGIWLTDPANPYYAVEDGVNNSFVSAKSNYVFKLKGYSNVREVKLIGNFSKWEKGEYTLAHRGDEWTITLYLRPGKYLYKFVVDRQQITDPDNKLREPGEDDTDNSVLWIE